jgi:anti-anti-sigma regulatory factor
MVRPLRTRRLSTQGRTSCPPSRPYGPATVETTVDPKANLESGCAAAADAGTTQMPLGQRDRRSRLRTRQPASPVLIVASPRRFGGDVLLGQGPRRGSSESGRVRETRVQGVTPPRLCLVTAHSSGVVVLRPDPVLDEAGCAGLAEILRDLFAGRPQLAVAVDLTKVDRFDQAAGEMFDRTASAAEQCGGTLTLRCGGDDFEAALTASGLARLISTTAGSPPAVRSPAVREACLRNHPSGRDLPDPAPATTGRPTTSAELRCIQ